MSKRDRSSSFPGLTSQAQTFVADHRWKVQVIARRLLARGARASLEDLVSWGYEGLVDFAARMDPARSESASRGVWIRIDGAMRDGMRRERRHHRLVVNASERAAAGFMAGLDENDPFLEAPEEGMAVLVDEAFGLVASRLLGVAAALHRHTEEMLGAHQELARAKTCLEQAMAALPQRDREILHLHYFEQLDMREVAEKFHPHVPYSTLTRYHRDALVRLGKHLRKHGIAAVPRG